MTRQSNWNHNTTTQSSLDLSPGPLTLKEMFTIQLFLISVADLGNF